VGAQLRLSVIIPVRDGGTDFQVCLEALAASSRPPDELLVVDDASADDSADTARQAGARLVARNETARGPAACRNMGAEAASGDVLVFVDADVRVHPQALAGIENHLVSSPDVAALFGSYDDDPPHRNLVSRYKNLLHHWVHQHSRREASTFWSGLGAIRRDVFDAVGGFDEAYALPSIEDIELGVRLTSSGHRVWLCPDVQGAHLKRWGLVSMLRADVFRRALRAVGVATASGGASSRSSSRPTPRRCGACRATRSRSSWAAQRIKDLDLLTAIKHALRPGGGGGRVDPDT
jgi:glycosyltransferase involved in cell wall biosynthesis